MPRIKWSSRWEEEKGGKLQGNNNEWRRGGE